MFRVECLCCLCKTCSRGSCRYSCDICFARCCSSARPLTYCSEYSSNFKGKKYIISSKKLRSIDFISKMTVSDLIALVVNLIDEKRN